jgi:microcystin-dependent protein
MPHVVENRILETTTTVGAGTITLAAAVTGFRRFSAVCAIGDTVPYFIEALDSTGIPSGDYEYGIGTYSAANQLTRTLVKGSSNAGAPVNFAAGSKNVGMAALGGDLVPTGASFDMTGSVVPSGYVEADGALLSRAQYPALWAYAQASGNMSASDAAWATAKGQYSPGDGATTFRTPDARGEFIRGWDHGRGLDAGRTIGSMQSGSIEAHTHSTGQTGTGLNGSVATTGATIGVVGSGVAITGSTGGTETRPHSIAWMKIIKT